MKRGLFFDLELEREGRFFRYNGHAVAEILGVAGPSGAGKTTLLRLLSGLEKPTRGFLELDGRVLVDTASGRYLPPEARRIGMVFQDARLFPHLSVERNIRYALPGGRRRKRNSEYPNPEPLFDLLEIQPLLKRKPIRLSGGERQRVALARALIANPRCLLLDEPFGALDNRMKAGLLPVLEDLRRSMEIPMVMVSHSPKDLDLAAGRILDINDGISTPAAPRRRKMMYPREAVS